MRLADIGLELVIAKSRFGKMLNPRHASRGKIRGWTQAGQTFKDFEGNAGHLEREAWLIILPPADSEHLAANLPDMRSAPLDHIGGCRKGTAKLIKLLIGHRNGLGSGLRTAQVCTKA